MQIRDISSGGVVTVNETFGNRLIEAGGWESADAPKPARGRGRGRARQEPAPVEEPQTQE